MSHVPLTRFLLKFCIPILTRLLGRMYILVGRYPPCLPVSESRSMVSHPSYSKCFTLVFLGVTNTMTRSNMGKKGFWFCFCFFRYFHVSPLPKEAGQEPGPEIMEKCCLPSCSLDCSYRAQAHLPRDGTTMLNGSSCPLINHQSSQSHRYSNSPN